LKNNFIHLHLHSKYSLLDGMCKFDDMIESCRNYGMHSCAITDHGYMYGVVEFYSTLSAAGIKPIIGLETYLVDDIREKSREKNHLVLLVKNEAGYKNLLKIATFACTEGFYYKPTIDKKFLKDHAEGLIAMSACLQGEVPRAIINSDPDAAYNAAQEYLKTFGEGNFYLEMQNHGIEEEIIMNRGLRELSKKTSIPLVVTNDTHYMKMDDAKAQDILVCIKTGKKLNETDRLSFKTNEFYFKNFEEMKHAFPDDEEAVLRTLEIAEKCNFELEVHSKAHMPLYDLNGAVSYDDVLEKNARDSFAKKFPEPSQEASDRLGHEIKVIKQMGYSGYFLIVCDIIKFARDHDIPVGPGRGSAAGSLVSYVLGITSINPLKYGLLFERFLNPERVSPPDIDTDYADNERDKVIQFIVNKFGNDRVAQIVTFQQLKPKQSIRDVGRVLDVKLFDVNRLAKLVPEGPNISFKDVLKDDAFRSFVNNEPWADEVLSYALKVEGMLRQDSTHAAGVAIAPSNLTDFVPLAVPRGAETDGTTTLGFMTQYQMESLEKIGIIKFDILGLRNLTVIKKAIELIKKNTGEVVELKEDDYTDPEVYALLSSGNTQGVFQLESDGMRDILGKMRPTVFEDIIAIISLFRPGPMKMIDDFIKRKKGLQPITYDFPVLEKVLKETYGIAVYQEQVMQIAMEVAGFTVAKADNLRRAMAKKKEKEMAKIRVEFVKGAKEINNIPEEKSEDLFEKLNQFSQYGFNKSHAAAYAVLAYQTAYLKAHYKSEYMAALLTSVMDKTEKTAFYINDCKENGVMILPPDVNKSDAEFSVERGMIRYGLAAIKNVGFGASEEIVKQRKEKGEYKDIFDFCRKISGRIVNSKTIESLVKAGAFDELFRERSSLFAAVPLAMKKAESYQDDQDSGQFSLFGPGEDKVEMPDTGEWPESQKLTYEREVLGTYLSSHPLTKYQRLLANVSVPIEDIKNEQNPPKGYIITGGIIHDMQSKTNSKGEETLHFILEDLTDKIEVIVSEKTRREKPVFEENTVLMVRGRVNFFADNAYLYLESVIPVSEAYHMLGKYVHIKMREIGLEEATANAINRIITDNKGTSTVIMHLLTKDGKEMDMTLDKEASGINVTEDVIHQLETAAGQENVWFTWKK
jgi:DNA polymerase-3 subunit alpha